MEISKRVEKYIQDYTRNCSNEIEWNVESLTSHDYVPWLTPDQARRAVEIAREEMIDKFCEWVKKNVTYIHPRKGTEECVINLGKLKEAMKDE